jgi:hypothetical protein
MKEQIFFRAGSNTVIMEEDYQALGKYTSFKKKLTEAENERQKVLTAIDSYFGYVCNRQQIYILPTDELREKLKRVDELQDLIRGFEREINLAAEKTGEPKVAVNELADYMKK